MNTFERYLTVWVGLCIVVGVGLGHALPGLFQAIGGMEIANAYSELNDPAEQLRTFEEQVARRAAGFGMLVDRFGVPWMVNCEQPS